jgi:hypothetical protein
MLKAEQKRVHPMQHFRFRRAIPAAFLVVSVSISLPTMAAPPVKERLPLTLSGSGCEGKQTEMNRVLQAIPGVTGVYFNRVPEHVLVDIIPSAVKATDVVNRVNDAATSWQCKVELMQSCISADMPTASAAPHQHR